jgi:hypothetical protein
MDGTEQLLVAHILINNWLKFNLRNTNVSMEELEETENKDTQPYSTWRTTMASV